MRDLWILVSLEKVAPVLSQRRFDREPPEVVEVATPQGENLTGPQTAVGEHQDQRTPPKIDRVRQCLDLLGAEGVPGPAGGDRQPETCERVGGDDPGIEGRREDHAGHDTCAVDRRVRVAGGSQCAQPLLHVDAAEGTEPAVPDMRQHLQPQGPS
jgi:hypothetical protein